MGSARFPWPLALALAALPLALAGCGPPEPAATPTPGLVLITVEPISSRPTEENPAILLHLVITDAATGEPVEATVIVDGRTYARNVAEFKVRLPGDLEDQPVTVAVEAPGYKRWRVAANWRVEHSRVMQVPVKLEKAGPGM